MELKSIMCGMKAKRKNPTRYELELRLMETQKLLDQGLNGKQIAEKLGVGKSTGERYVQTVTKRNKVKWEQIELESLESRAIKVKEIYDKVAVKAQDIIDDPETSAKDLEIAAKLCIGAHQNIYNLLKEGPLMLRKKETKALEEEDKDD